MTVSINVTKSAADKLYDLLADEGNMNLMLRVFVQGGGCSGFQYGFAFEDAMNEDDFEFLVPTSHEGYSVKIIVDTMSYQYLIGADIDYKEDKMGSQFSIKNPSATTTCGCGSSFSI